MKPADPARAHQRFRAVLARATARSSVAPTAAPARRTPGRPPGVKRRFDVTLTSRRRPPEADIDRMLDQLLDGEGEDA